MISVGALALYIHILGNNRAIEGGRVLVYEDLSIRGVDDTLEFAVASGIAEGDSGYKIVPLSDDYV